MFSRNVKAYYAKMCSFIIKIMFSRNGKAYCAKLCSFIIQIMFSRNGKAYSAIVRCCIQPLHKAVFNEHVKLYSANV